MAELEFAVRELQSNINAASHPYLPSRNDWDECSLEDIEKIEKRLGFKMSNSLCQFYTQNNPASVVLKLPGKLGEMTLYPLTELQLVINVVEEQRVLQENNMSKLVVIGKMSDYLILANAMDGKNEEIYLLGVYPGPKNVHFLVAECIQDFMLAVSVILNATLVPYNKKAFDSDGKLMPYLYELLQTRLFILNRKYSAKWLEFFFPANQST